MTWWARELAEIAEQHRRIQVANKLVVVGVPGRVAPYHLQELDQTRSDFRWHGQRSIYMISAIRAIEIRKRLDDFVDCVGLIHHKSNLAEH